MITPADINAILTALIARKIPVNIRQVVSRLVVGSGTDVDPWGPQNHGARSSWANSWGKSWGNSWGLLTQPSIGGGGWWFPNTKRPWELEDKTLRPILQKIVKQLLGEEDAAPVIKKILAPFVADMSRPRVDWDKLMKDIHAIREIIIFEEQRISIEEEMLLFMMAY